MVILSDFGALGVVLVGFKCFSRRRRLHWLNWHPMYSKRDLIGNMAFFYQNLEFKSSSSSTSMEKLAFGDVFISLTVFLSIFCPPVGPFLLF